MKTQLIAIHCKARDLTHRVAEATEGEDLAPLLAASIRKVESERREEWRRRVHAELDGVLRQERKR